MASAEGWTIKCITHFHTLSLTSRYQFIPFDVCDLIFQSIALNAVHIEFAVCCAWCLTFIVFRCLSVIFLKFCAYFNSNSSPVECIHQVRNSKEATQTGGGGGGNSNQEDIEACLCRLLFSISKCMICRISHNSFHFRLVAVAVVQSHCAMHESAAVHYQIWRILLVELIKKQ